MHNIVSKHSPICSPANTLASCPELDSLREWDLKLRIDDHFKTDEQVDKDVHRLIEHATDLKSGKF